ncbi:MAG: hypothetical protein ACYS76_09210 [Planctomycetota bacterium]|jgi:hypothetical protein
MRINPKRIATLYFSSWWLPFVAAFCALAALVVLCMAVMAFTFASYLGLMSMGLFILLCFALLGILIAGTWNLVKKRWAEGLVNLLVMLPLLVIAALFGFGFLMAASIFGPFGDGLGPEIVIPPDMALEEPRLKIALMLQSYDPWETGFCGSFIKQLWKSCLEWGEKRCNIKFDLTVLSEDDIILGRLEEDGFDVLIGPGGSGTWYAEDELRERIRTYISNGGNYLGVCGDGVFGTLGFTNVSPRLEEVFLRQGAKTPYLEPFLEVANVYTDLSAMEKISDRKLKTLLFRILFSPVNFYFPETGIPTLKAYEKRTLKVNWAFMMAVPGDKGDMSVVNIDIVYADDWVFPRGSLKGKAAQVSTTYGKGKIILTGLHAELSKRTYGIVMGNLLWLANPGGKASFAPPDAAQPYAAPHRGSTPR